MMHRILLLLFILFFIAPAVLVTSKTNNNPLPTEITNNNQSNLPASSPENEGLKPEVLTRIDSIVTDGVNNRYFPGCQILVMKNGKTVYNKCFGSLTYEKKTPVTLSTLYDLASLTKSTATLLGIMKLYDTGKIQLSDKASKYLDFLRNTDKENITIQDLLFHETGLPGSLPFHNLVIRKKTPASNKKGQHYIPLNSKTMEYNEALVSRVFTDVYNIQVTDSFFLHKDTHDQAMMLIAKTRLSSKTYLYSCVNFILLKEIVETISLLPLNKFLENEFYLPMDLKNITFLPLQSHKKELIAPTLQKDYLRNGVIQGYVHDPAAAFLGGVSGNAGLFSTSEDLATVYQMLLNGGEWNGKRYLTQKTCQKFTTTTSPSGRRRLGFDKPAPTFGMSSPCCSSTPNTVYGHTGYTGTCCWVDPTNKMIYVFLSNRTYPNDGINMLARMNIRTKIQETIYKSMK